jgi:hypothetical protein
MKKIVTHRNPDLDAAASVWLIKRFLPGWESAQTDFVSAGRTLADQPADSDPEILHVDTGLGRLDHHQLAEINSAAQLTWDFILEKRKNQPPGSLEKEAIDRILEFVTITDNARDLAWPEAKTDRLEFYLHVLIYGIKRVIPDDAELIDYCLILLDGLLVDFKDKIRAEEVIEEKGIKFETPWGKGLACETGNEKVLWEGKKMGYVLVVKYDQEFQNRVKIYSRFDSRTDLTKVYKKFLKIDSGADWFLHSSKKLLLISSDPEAKGTKLSLEEIIQALKK